MKSLRLSKSHNYLKGYYESFTIISSGGNHRERDNSAFYLEYDIRDDTFFPALLNIINKNKMSSDNGHTIHVNGLPEGYGDELHVKSQAAKQS